MLATRAWFSVLAAVAVIVVGCSPAVSMSDDALAECVDLTAGSLGGSSNTISGLAVRLPEASGSLEGASTKDVQADFDQRFDAAYGISVDEFLALRDDADEATRNRLGEAPGLGEHVSNEWFVERDRRLMMLWDQRYPQSAQMYCDLAAAEAP